MRERFIPGERYSSHGSGVGWMGSAGLVDGPNLYGYVTAPVRSVPSRSNSSQICACLRNRQGSSRGENPPNFHPQCFTLRYGGSQVQTVVQTLQPRGFTMRSNARNRS